MKPLHRNAIYCTDLAFHSLIISLLSARHNSVIKYLIKTESICICKFNTSFGKHSFHEKLLGCPRCSAVNKMHFNYMDQVCSIQMMFWSGSNQKTRNARVI